VADAKCGKTRAGESRLVLVLLLIGRKSGASFLNQSGSVVNAKPITFRHSNENRSREKRKTNARMQEKLQLLLYLKTSQELDSTKVKLKLDK